MYPKRLCNAAAACLLGAVMAFGGSMADAQSSRAVLHFADLGGIRNWQADGSDALFIESVHGDWYRATFWAPCVDLPFAIAIAFVTEPNGNLERFSSILVDGERCSFRTFEHATEPPTSSIGRVTVR